MNHHLTLVEERDLSISGDLLSTFIMSLHKRSPHLIFAALRYLIEGHRKQTKLLLEERPTALCSSFEALQEYISTNIAQNLL